MLERYMCEPLSKGAKQAERRKQNHTNKLKSKLTSCVITSLNTSFVKRIGEFSFLYHREEEEREGEERAECASSNECEE